MTKKVYYEKVGRKYVPVAEYDSDFLDSFPKGNTLVMCVPEGTSRKYKIDPAYAPMIAAGRVAQEAISASLMKAHELRLPLKAREQPLTPEQHQAWENLVKVFGPSVRQLEWPSIHECAEAGVAAMQEEATKLLANPAVSKAWEYFMMVCDLTKEANANSTDK